MNQINPRHLPLWIERLANEGYTVNIQCSKKLVKITCEGYTIRNLMPFGQKRLNEFGG